MIIGLTGNAGSGKSTVAGFLRDCGAQIIDCDKIGHTLLSKENGSCYSAIVREFGRDILDEKGEIDRSRLGALVFPDDEHYNKLNSIMHPKIRREVEELIQEKEGIVVIDAAVLIQAKWVDLVDSVVLVVAEDQRRFRRLLDNGKTPPQIVNIQSRQPHQTELIPFAHFIIENNTTLADLKIQTETIWDEAQKQNDKESTVSGEL